MAQHEISQEVNEKVKKNLLKIFIFTAIMIFAGLTSAYLVQQGDRFWVNISMPDGFKYGTASIIISSLFLFASIYLVKKNNVKVLKLTLFGALIGGILFGYFQFTGFGQLFDKGSVVVSHIMTVDGRYGKHYSLTYEGKNITYNDDQFYLKGEPISEDLHDEIRVLGKELFEGAKTVENVFSLSNYGAKFMLLHKDVPVTYANNKLYENGNVLGDVLYNSLMKFGENLANDRGDFILQGKYGEDFWIYYNGQKLAYENREFTINGKPLSPARKVDLYSQQNSASSFIYVFTGMHLLHWIGGVIALLVVFIRGLKEKYTQSNYLGISLGSIYWHFLGILWLYLYAFLIYIH
ncbi:MAG: cytochrome c oxidase subunit 3 [Arenicella sp.]